MVHLLCGGHLISCGVPSDLLTEEEQNLLKNDGYEVINDGFWPYYHDVNIKRFPSIFYTRHTTRINDTDVPVYVQALLAGFPRRRNFGSYLPYSKEDLERFVNVADLFERDLEDLPLELFYERLFKLRGIGFLYNEDEKFSGRANFETRNVEFGSILKRYILNFDYVATLLLHEFYHFVEHELEDTVKLGSRWQQSKYFGEISWNYEGIEGMRTHLAEFLAALTYVKHTEVLEEIRPYYNHLYEKVNPNAPFFPRPKSIWFEK